MRKTGYILLLVPLVSLWMVTRVNAAAQTGDCEGVEQITWREENTSAFTILFPDEYEPVRRTLTADNQAAELDREYARLEALFEASLPTPVAIRVYPNAQTYACLNSQSEALPAGALHTPNGSREIALIGENIRMNFPAWVRSDLEFIRYDLAILFARQVAGDRLPPGLMTAVGHYAQDPEQTIGAMRLSWNDWLEPERSWRELWEDDGARSDFSAQLEATSSVAYLIDTYGWETFLTFLQSLYTAPGFGQALEQAYGIELTGLEAGWREYYPAYFQGGWRSHVLYDYDLAGYHALIQAEKYAEADRELQAAIEFMQKLDNHQGLREAQALILRAKHGQEAEYQFAQSRQAFLEGRYMDSLALLEQAQKKYRATGNSFYHLDEFSAYREQINEVIVLHAEVDRLEERLGNDWNTFALSYQLVGLGRRLAALGDQSGYQRVQAMAGTLEEKQYGQYLLAAAAVLIIVIILLANVIRLMQRTPPPEAQL